MSTVRLWHTLLCSYSFIYIFLAPSSVSICLLCFPPLAFPNWQRKEAASLHWLPSPAGALQSHLQYKAFLRHKQALHVYIFIYTHTYLQFLGFNSSHKTHWLSTCCVRTCSQVRKHSITLSLFSHAWSMAQQLMVLLLLLILTHI